MDDNKHGTRLRFALAVLVIGWLGGCATVPPARPLDLCAVFDEYPEWYDYAKESQEKWGTPINIQMAFINKESGYQEDARPPFKWFLFIPLGRDSSAEGYAQIQDPAWEDYTDETGGLFKSRTDMEDALDFIGWYNAKSRKLLGISLWDPKHLYIAYHEGWGGYRSGAWKNKSDVLRRANKVDWQAREYGAQLKRCESRFKCRHWYQFFCS